MSRPVVLVCADYFRPGFKGGGPVTSLSNMAATLAEEVDFHIVTRDRDLGDTKPYPGIEPGVFHQSGGAKVMYLQEADATVGRFVELLRELAPQALYLNSMLSRRFSLRPLVAAKYITSIRRNSCPMQVVIAPRGEFAAGALSIKARRKSLYLKVMRNAGLWNGVRWQASSPFEADDIRTQLRSGPDIVIAPDLAAPLPNLGVRPPKSAGRASFVFLGRISPIKNLEHSIQALSGIKGKASLTAYGPIEDEPYWRKCQAVATSLPDNIAFSHGGTLAPEKVALTLSQADALLLQSLSENFAQVVIEAMGCGCPVVLSDRTPWRSLAAVGAGWDLPIEDVARTTSVLQSLVDMDEQTHSTYRTRTRAYAADIIKNPEQRRKTLSLFT